MRTGKLEWSFMSKLLSMLPIDDIDLVVGPAQGEDAAVIRLRDGFLVIHSDPITTGVKRAGYLAIHVAGNDIAVRGVRPRWFLPVILFPSTFSENDVLEFFSDMNQALREIGGVVVGGHTEITPGINRPIVTVTAAGYTSTRVILTRDARPGDLVYIIGRVGGEGAGIIAWDFENILIERSIERDLVEKARRFIYEISAIKVALAIKDYVSAMHDATEGGILQALREIAVASGTKIFVDRDNVRLEEPVLEITKAVNVDPLRLLSSGCIIATVHPSKRSDLEKILDSLKVTYGHIGYVDTGDGVVVVRTREGEEVIYKDIIDEIYKLWS